nr:hypothetical protein [Shewanella sp. Isolate11]
MSQAAALIELEHNQAQQLVNEGKILSLDLALSNLEEYCSGKLLDANLYQSNGDWLYSLQLRNLAGDIISFTMNATTGKPKSHSSIPKACQVDKLAP